VSDDLAARIVAGEPVDVEAVDRLDAANRATLVERLIAEPAGRRWLRASPLLDTGSADRLLGYEEDFRVQRRDRTLDNVIALASEEELERRIEAVAAGPGAAALWQRLSGKPGQLLRSAVRVLSDGDQDAAAATLYLLVLDPVSDYAIARDDVTTLALAGLASPHGIVRGLAAEHLVDHTPAILAERAPTLVLDNDERLRGHAWHAFYLCAPDRAQALALELLGNEDTPLPIRRSALVAYGEHLPTSKVAELLAFFVQHPEETLALDAAQLMFRLHRYPTIAMAAAESPHPPVRELALFLLDPYRGSPAAGGSRPGDPTTGDIFAELARRLDESEPPR
jgi:hypothetical protein